MTYLMSVEQAPVRVDLHWCPFLEELPLASRRETFACAEVAGFSFRQSVLQSTRPMAVVDSRVCDAPGLVPPNGVWHACCLWNIDSFRRRLWCWSHQGTYE